VTSAKNATSGSLSSSSQQLARQMANRRLRHLLEERLVASLDARRVKFSGLPSPSQLARVRLAARHALARQDLGAIRHHMASLTGARKDWTQARLDKDELFGWIETKSQPNLAAFQEEFDLMDQLPSIAGVSAELTPELEVEFRARLIDGVMKLATEKKKAQQGGAS
jgi:hypothetical protein